MIPVQQFRERYGLDMAAPDTFHLKAISAAFSHLPYENVTKILKDRRSTDTAAKLRMPDEVLADHLRWNTGGTCFSLCNTLLEVLGSSGYDAHIAMGDMHYGANIHCAVVVTLPGGRWLLDPGYLIHVPVPLPDAGGESIVRTQMNTVVLRREAPQVFSLFTREEGTEKWRYRLRTERIPQEEFVQHWVHSFSLNSMEQVVLSRLSDAGRIYYRKDRLDVVGERSRRKTRIAPGSHEALADAFGLPSSLIAEAQRAVLARPS